MVFVDKLTKMVHYVATTTNVTAPQLADALHARGRSTARRARVDPERSRPSLHRSLLARILDAARHDAHDEYGVSPADRRSDRACESHPGGDAAIASSTSARRLGSSTSHAAELAINNAQQASTGFSPFHLNYGQEVQLPLDQAIAGLRPSNNPEAAERIRRLKDRSRLWLASNIEKAQAAPVAATPISIVAMSPSRWVTQVLLSTEHLKMVGADKRTPKFACQVLRSVQGQARRQRERVRARPARCVADSSGAERESAQGVP